MKKMYHILILDCPEIGCHPTMLRVYSEFAGAFRRKGIDAKISNSIKEITEYSIVLLGDSFRVRNPTELLHNHCQCAIYIGWYWQNQNTSMLPYFVNVYENILADNPLPDKVFILKYMKSISNSCPLLLRADEAVEDIGKYERNVNKDYCYMGFPMGETFIPNKPYKGFYYGVTIDKYLDYNTRRNMYLSSTFALGFQHEDNIINNHVSQRIFEGIAYGCVVLSNSISACLQTDCIVEHFNNKEDLEQKMKYFLENPDKIKEKQEKGYEFVKEKGTNNYAARKIINIIQTFKSQTPIFDEFQKFVAMQF